MGAYLVPDGKGRRIPLDKAVIFIGRHPDCDIVLTRSRKISRKHCCVAQVDDRLVVRDLGSMNGVRVNNRPVEKEVTLRVGDRVAIGDLEYVLQVERPENGKRSPRPPANGAESGPIAAVAATPEPEPKPLAPWQVSQEFPVAIPDEEQSFQVESSHLDARESVDSSDVVPVEESGEIYRLTDEGPIEGGDSFVDLKPE